MICQKCHKNLSSVRYAEVVDGKVNDLHLCVDCMKKYQDDATTGFELSGPLRAPAKHSAARGSTPDSTTIQKRVCRQCGAVLKEVLKTGRVGCPSCYENFSEQLYPMLRGLHTAMRHRGKMPQINNDDRERSRVELQGKRALLRSALKLENYEEAAKLRDEVRALEENAAASAPERS